MAEACGNPLVSAHGKEIRQALEFIWNCGPFLYEAATLGQHFSGVKVGRTMHPRQATTQRVRNWFGV